MSSNAKKLWQEPPNGLPAAPFADYPDVVRVEDVAKMLDIGRNHAYGLISAGTIRSLRIGRLIRIPKSAVIEYCERRD